MRAFGLRGFLDGLPWLGFAGFSVFGGCVAILGNYPISRYTRKPREGGT